MVPMFKETFGISFWSIIVTIYRKQPETPKKYYFKTVVGRNSVNFKVIEITA